MQVVEKNEGPKIPYSKYTTKLTINSEITIDLSKYERDFPVHLDICRDKFDILVMGLGERYVAQVDIPAREYTYEQNGTDEEGNPKFDKVPVPFNMDNVTLTLWSLGG